MNSAKFNPLTAIEHQLDLIRKAYKNTLSPICLVAGTEFSSRYFMQEVEADQVRNLVNGNDISFAPLVAAATPAFISADMVEIIVDAMSTLPDSTSIQPYDLQAQTQFIWLENPVKLSSDPIIKFTYHVQGFLIVSVPEELQAGWAEYHKTNIAPLHDDDDKWMPQSRPPETLIYTLGYLINYEDEHFTGRGGRVLSDWNFLDVLDWQNWLSADTVASNWSYDRGRDYYEKNARSEGASDGEVVSYSYFNNEIEVNTVKIGLDEYLAYADLVAYESRRLAAAVVHFMAQRIVKISRREFPPSRQQIRAAQRENKPLPPTPFVNIIKLRSIDYAPTENKRGEEGHRQLKERHIVRSYWRNQYYPSLGAVDEPGTHKPKLIPSCIRGPEGTPIRGGSKLFAIVR